MPRVLAAAERSRLNAGLALLLALGAGPACGGAPPPAKSVADVDARLGGGREVPRASAQVEAGEAKLSAGDPAAAKALFVEAIAANPRDPRAHLDLGLAEEMLGAPGAAEAAYREAISLQPDLSEALNNLALLRRADGDIQEAISLLRRAVKAEAGSASAYQNLALALEDNGDLEAARDAYQRALSLAPKDLMTRVNYGLLLVSLGEVEAGTTQLAKARSGAAGNRPALLAIGNGLRQAGAPQAAVVALGDAIAAGDGQPTPALLSELALAQRLAGDRDGAIATLQEALSLDASYGTAHYLLGNLLAASKRFKRAQAHYEAYLRVEPDGPQAAKARQRLAVVKGLR